MSNPLYEAYGNNANNNGLSQLMAQAEQLKKQLNGANPQALVRQLLNSGEMSQAQFNEYAKIVRSMGGNI